MPDTTNQTPEEELAAQVPTFALVDDRTPYQRIEDAYCAAQELETFADWVMKQRIDHEQRLSTLRAQSRHITRLESRLAAVARELEPYANMKGFLGDAIRDALAAMKGETK